jgi:hypothetical protein
MENFSKNILFPRQELVTGVRNTYIFLPRRCDPTSPPLFSDDCCLLESSFYWPLLLAATFTDRSFYWLLLLLTALLLLWPPFTTLGLLLTVPFTDCPCRAEQRDVETFVFFFPSLILLNDKEEGVGLFFFLLGVSLLHLSPREVTLLLQWLHINTI